jgi:hypothetical protein
MAPLGRSMTPDSMGDHNKEMFRRNPGGGKPGKPTAADTGIVPENLLNAAAQIVSMSNSAAAGAFSDFAPTGTAANFQFSELMASSSNPRFAVPSSSSAAAPLHHPLSNNAGNNYSQSTLPPLTKPPPPTSSSSSSIKLNPNAPDFLRIQTPGADYLRANSSRMPTAAPPSKSFHQFGSSRFNPQGPPPPPMGNLHGLPGNPSSFQNILTNQGINAFLSQQQQQTFDFPAFDVNLSGRTLRELTEMLSVDPGANFPPPALPPAPTGFLGGVGGMSDAGAGKFSRPIGSERHNMRPPPPAAATVGGGVPTLAKNPWDLPGPGLYDPLVGEIGQGNFGFGLTGASGFDGFGKSSFNGSAAASDYVSPMKSDFSFNSNLGGSAGKKVSNSYMDLSTVANNRPDASSIRRNMVIFILVFFPYALYILTSNLDVLL